jgi:hypothetical protein
MGKAVKLTRNRFVQLIFILFLISLSPGFVVYAEDLAPAPEAAPAPVVEAIPVVAPAPEPVAVPEVVPVPEAVPQPAIEPISEVVPVSEVIPQPIIEPTPEVIPVPEVTPIVTPDPAINPADQEIFDETFTNPVPPDPTTTDPIPAPVDPDELFSEPPKEEIPAVQAPEPGSLTKEEIKKLDEVFTNTDIKEEIVKAPGKIEPQKEKIEPLHSCAFDDFSIEMGSNEKKSKPILLKKSGPNKKFGLKVGDLPEGIEINFSTGGKDFTAGESGSQSLAQKFSDLENKAANKELIFNESILEEKDPLAKSKEAEQKIDKSDIIVEEISITSSSDTQKGSFNIPIIYAESDEIIGEQNIGSASTIEATCQFNLIVK